MEQIHHKFFCCDKKFLQQNENGANSLIVPSNDQVWRIISFDGAISELAPF